MKISDLTHNPKNPRKITDEKLAMLKKSLQSFGDLSGVIYNRVTNRLAGGHQRTKVLPADAEVTVVKQYDKPTGQGTIALGHIKIGDELYAYREVMWDEATELAANVAANNQGGEFDFIKLPDILLEIDQANIDLNLTGFSDEELKEIMAPLGNIEPVEGEDEIPEQIEAKTKPGDLYILGNHRLLCGDATFIDPVEKLMNGEKADMAYCDPPYGANIVNANGPIGGDKAFGNIGNMEGKMVKAGVYAPIIGDESTETAKASFDVCAEFTKTQIFWGAQYYAEALPPNSGWIVWDKETDGSLGDGELAYSSVKKAIRIFKHKWSGMIKASEHGQRRVHPTQKPVALAEWCFENYGNPKTVLDLFGGSGSTLIACEKTNRKCFMMELAPYYCDVIVARWEKFTGKQAELVTDEKPKTIRRKANDNSSIRTS